ncbi:MAG: YihY/virulence factor BrkB family protein [Desulfobacter sp.]
MDIKDQIRYFHKKLSRVLWRAARGFRRDNCALRASALTLYTLFSIVPVMAMAFGMAKGFGFQQFLEAEVLAMFAGREEIAVKVVAFSNNLLEKTKGGVMAVFGVVLLFYSLVKLMGHIENAFNRIWWVPGGRSIIRKITDYLTISLAAGLLVILSGSANLFVTTRLEQLLAYLGLPINVEGMISLGLSFFPYLFTWMLFIFFYVILPNKRVDIRAAVAGGIIGGTLFQFIQMVYLKFQVGMTSYNAIYGSFAALPLFLIWLQASWVVLLYGAEIASEWENTDLSETRDVLPGEMSQRQKKIIMLGIIRLCVDRFARNQSPATDIDMSRELKLPLAIVRHLLEKLLASRLLFAVTSPDARVGYSPAMDIECMTVMDVLSAVEHQKVRDADIGSTLISQAFEESLDCFDTAARNCAGERKLKDI